MKRKLFLVLVLITSGLLVLGGAGEVLIRPALHPVGAAPSDLPVQPVVLQSATAGPVAGWFVQGKPRAGAVLLLHGVRADRREMVSRAEFLYKQGYSVLLIDLPGHGESSAEHITFGFNEAAGVTAALEFLSSKLPSEKIGVIGVSLGAASLVLSRPQPAPSAVILESMYPTITEAVSDRLRLRLGAPGAYLAPLLVWQLPVRLGITSDQLRPIAEISALHAPVMIISGSIDRHTTIDETGRIYNAANQPKELWVVKGAGHINMHAFARETYEEKVSAFFAKHLRQGRSVGGE